MPLRLSRIAFSAVIALAAANEFAFAQGTITKAPFRFSVNSSGQIVGLETPVGTSQGTNTETGYALCIPDGPAFAEVDMEPFAIKQPNGVNTLPLSVVVRDPTDTWEITWTYTVDPKENELLTTAKVKKLSGPASNAVLRMGFVLDPNLAPNSYADVAPNVVWQRSPAVGFSFWGITSAFPRTAASTLPHDVVANPFCNVNNFAGLPAFGDANPQMTYSLGSIGGGKSKTVAFQLRRH